VIGIVGIPTAGGALPTTGSVNYTGDSNVTIQDDLIYYELSGEAVVVANFGTDRVTTTIDDLSGERTIGAGNASAVSNVGSIEFSDSVMTGATFTGGTVVVNSAELSNLSADAVSTLDGVVYGPNGEEIGGVFIVNDAATSGVTIFGDFLAAD